MTRSHLRLVGVAAITSLTLLATLGAQTRPDVALRTAIELEEVKGDVKGAIVQYARLAEQGDRSVAARALLRLANVYEKTRDQRAVTVYERIVRDFGDQPQIRADAQARLSALAATGEPRLPVARKISDFVAAPRPSLDGRLIPFAMESGDLAIHDLKTNTSRQLTNTGGWVVSGDFVSDPVISPDNRFVAYSWTLEKEGMTELRVMPLQGAPTPRTVVRTDERYVMPMAWTPDGRRLIVSRRILGSWQLGVVTVATGAYTTLKTLEWRNPSRGVSLSPDGRYVAYQSPVPDRGSPRDILVIALDGSLETTAVAGAADDFNPLWSADGSYLVFTRADVGRPALWAVPMKGGRSAGPPVLIKTDAAQMNPLGIVRDGSLYYSVASTRRRNVFIAELENFAPRTPGTVVTGQSLNSSGSPSWSRDGESLTYVANRPRSAVVIRSIKTGQERAIAFPERVWAAGAAPNWFPDGRSILVIVGPAQGSGAAFARFDTETGTVEPLHRIATTNDMVSVALAPDGSAIYWAYQSTGQDSSFVRRPSGRLLRFDLKTREEQELKRDEWFLAMALSPDGKQLAYLKNVRTGENTTEAPGILEVMPASGGEARQVFRDPVWYGGNRYNTLAWTPDQKNLIAVRDDDMLWRFPLAGGAPQAMGISNLTIPAIRPDGKMIAFARTEVDSSGGLWKLENFLPVAGRK